VQANNGSTNTTLLAIGSSTASATTTLFTISNTGALTQQGGATSTFSNGLNVTAGCFAINGTCLSSSGATNAAGGTGAVQFANGTSFAGDAATFFWDNSAKRLGLGTATPAYTLDVAGFINTDKFSGYKQDGTTILYASSTTGSLSVGASSGITSGAFNTAVGNSALTLTTTGANNTALGAYTLANNISSNSNVAIGYAASFNATGAKSVTIGQEAGNGVGGSYSSAGNVAVGYRAGYSFLDASDYNTLLGFQAGSGITSGAHNVIIGADSDAGQANSNLSSGSGNIQIGYNISLPSATASNQLDIGNLIYGKGLNGSGNVAATGTIGIGSSSPFARLTVHANNGDINTTLFAIGSSTSAATTTLFSISNTGSIFTQLASGLVASNNGTLYQVSTSTSFVTSIAQTFGTAQTGAITFATTSGSNNGQTIGLNITNSSGAFTFTPTLSGTLNVTGGGTGLSSVGDGQLVYGGTGTSLVALATSTGGFLTNSFSTGRPVWSATSTLYGTGTGGQLLTWNNGVPQWVASTTYANGTGISTSFATGQLTITNTGVTSIGPTGQTATGAVIFATSSTAFNGLTASTTITSAGGAGATLTFSNTLAGLLNVTGGGTGLSSVGDGRLVFGSGGTTLTALATSTGGFLTNSYVTGRPVWSATSTLNILLSDTLGTLAANRGGTGFSSYTPGDILYADTSSTLARVASSTDGFVLALANGKPSWVASSTLSTITGTLTVAKGGTGLTSVGDGQLLFGGIGGGSANLVALATSTGGFLTNSYTTGRPAWVATSTLNLDTSVLTTGTLGVSRGGTGQSTFTSSQLLYGNGTNGLTSVATTTFAVSGPFVTSGTLGALVGGSNSTVTYTGLATTSQPSSSNILVSNGGAGVYGVATTTFTPSAEFTTTGTIGALVGGANSTLALATNGVALTKLAQIGANTILGNSTGATGNVTAFATSTLGIALSDTTGILGVSRGGTGQSTFTSSQLLYGNGTNGLTSVATTTLTSNNGLTLSAGAGALVGGSNATIGLATINAGVLGAVTNGSVPTSQATSTLYGTGTGGQLLTWNNGVPQWVASTTYANGTGISTSFATGQLTITNTGVTSIAQTGGGTTQTGAITFATSSSATTGLTLGLNITNSSGAFTFSPSLSGTLNVANGGTGLGSFTANSLLYSNSAGTALAFAATSTLNIGGTASNVTGIVAIANGGTNSNGFTTNQLDFFNGTALVSASTTALNNARGTLGLGTTTPAFLLQLASSTAPQLTLSDGSSTNSPFNLRANGNYLTISTSSPTTFATTTSSFLTLNSSTGSTTLLKLDVSGNATSTFNNGTNLTAGCYAVSGTCLSLTSLGGTLGIANGGTGTTTAPASQLIYGGGAGVYQSVATTTFTPSAEFTTTGTIGALVGGANSTLALATNGVALTKLAQIGANTILGNSTGATGNVTAFATSTLGIALSDTTGILAIARGGTNSNGFTTNQLDFFNGTALVSASTTALNNARGTLGLGTTTPAFLLQLASSTAPQLTLSDGSSTNSPFNLRANGNYLTISTSSPTTFATTTPSILTFNSSTGSTTLMRLDVTAIATSSFAGGINVTTGCFAISGSCALTSSTGVTSIAQTFGTAQTGAITFATTSGSNNGQTIGLNITNSSGAFTLTPTLSGTLNVAGGGTGSTTLSGLLKGNGTGQVQTAVAGTDYLAPASATDSY
jgi:hypothetical protein